MDDYISRRAAIETVKFYAAECDPIPRVISSLEKIPATDMVEVVHCIDCINWDGNRCISLRALVISRPDAYCSLGERRSNSGYILL